MTTTKQKIRIGLFAVIAGTLLAVVLVVFTGLHFLRHHASYAIEFDDSVYGLEADADVFFNGIRVGRVDSIEIASDDLRGVRVVIMVDEDTPVRTDTKATLRLSGITGLKIIDLRGGTVGAPRLAAGGTIPTAETALDKLTRQATEMAEHSTELVTRANDLVGQAEEVVANLVEVTDPDHLGDIVAQARATTSNLAEASGQLRALIGENRAALRASIRSIDAAARSASRLIDRDLTGVLADVGDVAQQLDEVVRDEGAQLKGTMADLRQASRSFKELAREVRSRPSRLLFSGSLPDRKLP